MPEWQITHNSVSDIVRTTPTRSTRNWRTPSTKRPLWPWTTRRVPVTLGPLTRGPFTRGPYRPRKTPARLDQSTISTVVKGDQSPLIAGIVVAMLIIVGVLAAFAFLIYQRKRKVNGYKRYTLSVEIERIAWSSLLSESNHDSFFIFTRFSIRCGTIINQEKFWIKFLNLIPWLFF